MNTKDALTYGVRKLKHLANPLLEAEVLLAILLEKNRTQLKTYPEQKISPPQWLRYQWWIRKRAAHVPVAYITKKVEWNNLKLSVNKHTLIPRDETEVLCHLIVSAQKKPPSSILDVGTGCGCIALFLAVKFPNAHLQALDISKPALKIARKNALPYPVKIDFKHSNLLSRIKEKTHFDIIVANLPYVPKNQSVSAEVKTEPPTAIFSGKDGLNHIRQFAQQLEQKNIRFNQLWLEFLPNQATDIKALFLNYQVELKTGIDDTFFFVLIKPHVSHILPRK